MENLESQYDEIEALSAIYEENWKVVDESKKIFSLLLQNGQLNSVEMTITFPANYPSDSPPIYEINAPWLKGQDRQDLSKELEILYLENVGENMVYLWGEKVKEFLNKISSYNTNQSMENHQSDMEVKVDPKPVQKIPEIIHGETITDRKSVFQGHVAVVSNINDVNNVIAKLKENKKIASAAHNIVAYTFQDEVKGSLCQDCDDDGESAAGGRLLHLLQILQVENVLVIVTRWYGGIKLGPDRFKHINNAARKVLADNQFIHVKKSSSKKVK